MLFADSARNDRHLAQALNALARRKFAPDKLAWQQVLVVGAVFAAIAIRSLSTISIWLIPITAALDPTLSELRSIRQAEEELRQSAGT